MATILLIDDEEDIRNILSLMLTSAGHTVREAANGAEGLRLYRAAPTDLVITDVVMPEQEGLSTIMELRKLEPKLKIIAMSGGFAYDPKLYLHMATRLGAERVLRKPFSYEDLTSAVNAVLAAPPGSAPTQDSGR